MTLTLAKVGHEGVLTPVTDVVRRSLKGTVVSGLFQE